MFQVTLDFDEVILDISSKHRNLARVQWLNTEQDLWYPLEEVIQHKQVGGHVLTPAEYSWLISDTVYDLICEAIAAAEPDEPPDEPDEPGPDEMEARWIDQRNATASE